MNNFIKRFNDKHANEGKYSDNWISIVITSISGETTFYD